MNYSKFIVNATGGVNRNVSDKLSEFVSALDFMSTSEIADIKSGTASIDVSPKIQLALNTGKSVKLPGIHWVYGCASTLRFQAVGQLLTGEGSGDGDVGARTVIKYTGSDGGKVISLSNGTGVMMQNCAIRDLMIDCNHLAQIGIEWYDDTITTGAWRNKANNITVLNTRSGGIANHLGLGPFPRFAHDFIWTSSHIFNCGIGFQGAGAVYTLDGKSTIFGATIAGINMLAGSSWNVGDTIFTTNNLDFQGTDFQELTGSPWCENSTSGIGDTHSSGQVNLTAQHLHTNNASKLWNFNGSAGNWSISGNCPSSSQSRLVIGVNPQYSYDISNSNLLTETGIRKRIIGSQRVDNVAFAASLAADQVSVTGDGTVASLSGLAWNIDKDATSGAFNASTGVIAFPQVGDYWFSAKLALSGLTSAHTDLQLLINFGGQNYLIYRCNPGAIRTASNELQITGKADMLPVSAAGTTCSVSLLVSGGPKSVSVLSGGASVNMRTQISGRMH